MTFHLIFAHMRFFSRAYSWFLKAVAIGGVATVVLAGCSTGVDDRIRKVHALGRHPTEPNRNRIESRLRDEDRDVRATALVVMASIDADRAKRMAGDALDDPDGLVRAAAVTICGAGADAETIRLLTALANGDPVWQARARALEAIAGSDDPAVREAFARALSDSVRHVRLAALLAGIGRPGLLPVDRLSDLAVSDPDWGNRVEAARALGASNDPAAYPGLDAAVADPNEFVRAAAARELRSLQGAGVPR